MRGFVAASIFLGLFMYSVSIAGAGQVFDQGRKVPAVQSPAVRNPQLQTPAAPQAGQSTQPANTSVLPPNLYCRIETYAVPQGPGGARIPVGEGQKVAEKKCVLRRIDSPAGPITVPADASNVGKGTCAGWLSYKLEWKGTIGNSGGWNQSGGIDGKITAAASMQSDGGSSRAEFGHLEYTHQVNLSGSHRKDSFFMSPSGRYSGRSLMQLNVNVDGTAVARCHHRITLVDNSESDYECPDCVN